MKRKVLTGERLRVEATLLLAARPDLLPPWKEQQEELRTQDPASAARTMRLLKSSLGRMPLDKKEEKAWQQIRKKMGDKALRKTEINDADHILSTYSDLECLNESVMLKDQVINDFVRLVLRRYTPFLSFVVHSFLSMLLVLSFHLHRNMRVGPGKASDAACVW